MPRVVHFEIQVSDVARATNFYGKLFGWTFNEWMPGYWGVHTEGDDESALGRAGIDGGLFLRETPAPQPGQPVSSYVCAIGVDDCQAYADRAAALGGTIIEGRVPVPGVGYSIYCLDPEGNQFCLWQDDPSAA